MTKNLIQIQIKNTKSVFQKIKKNLIIAFADPKLVLTSVKMKNVTKKNRNKNHL